MLILSLLLLCACQDIKNESNNGEKLWATFAIVPDGYVETRILQLSDRQQYCYKGEDKTQRFVLEIQKENVDEVLVTDKELVSIKDMEGEQYTYQGEKIEYSGMDETEIQGILKIEKGENVLEWKQDKVFCRIYGTLSFEILLEIAENVELNYE